MEGFDYHLAAVSVVISFVSIFLVVFQLHNHTEQRKLESLLQIKDINRQLLALGFANPELFEILHDSKEVDPVLERRYLQLWFNQMALIHAIHRRGLFPDELRESLERDMRDFLKLENMRTHWRRYGNFYPTSFQQFVDGLMQEGGPPP